MAAISEEIVRVEEMRDWDKTINRVSLFYEDDIATALRQHGLNNKEISRLLEIGTLMTSKNNTAVGLFIMGQCVCWVSKYPIEKALTEGFKYKCLL